MELTLSIPALLFPAISLTMLAYNARYLAIAGLIRSLHKQFETSKETPIARQIQLLNNVWKSLKTCNLQLLGVFYSQLYVCSLFTYNFCFGQIYFSA